jgi:catechol 2,3-dioxygenase-like lactoylglutathione lyase family enzyme
MTTSGMQKTIECVIPILKVRDVDASLAFYHTLLGFTLDWRYDKDGFTIAGISRDGSAIYLTNGEQGNAGTWLWIGVDDLQTLYDALKAKPIEIVLPPTNFPWAYEMRVRDPDGHTLRIASDSLTDRPLVV